jgi:hypothetical protein
VTLAVSWNSHCLSSCCLWLTWHPSIPWEYACWCSNPRNLENSNLAYIHMETRGCVPPVYFLAHFSYFGKKIKPCSPSIPILISSFIVPPVPYQTKVSDYFFPEFLVLLLHSFTSHFAIPLNYKMPIMQATLCLWHRTFKQKNKNSVAWVRKRELYRPSDRRLSAKLVPNLADRGCRVVGATNPTAVNFSFLDRSRYSLKIAPQCVQAVIVIKINWRRFWWLRCYYLE